MTLEEKKEIVRNKAIEEMEGRPKPVCTSYVAIRLQKLEDGQIDVNDDGEIVEGAE